MPEKVIMYSQKEIDEHVYNELDEIKSWQEETLKQWVRETYPDPESLGYE